MKRVVCLYRVSTVGQVDHDDIPMQRIACREYAASHPDWEIVKEISEKGVSGYKIATNDRDAIMQIKAMAAARLFDVLLVFMFDRLGRRDDETPFVVQWFVEQGIEVWSTREGEQRFDTHVDKLLNYIRFWQASGESEKTSIRIRTKHSQMVQEGHYRGGLVAYGYHLEQLGRVNKRNQPVRDLVVDEMESGVVQQIFHMIADEGYGTNRVANWLNSHGIATKRNTTLWRATSVRALIDNPIYTGVIRFGDERSDAFENLRIVDDALFQRCGEVVRGRGRHIKEREVPLRTTNRALLTGVIYCAACGQRMTFNHSVKRCKGQSGIKCYERDVYRCYRKINSKSSCDGQSTYLLDKVEEPVLAAVRAFFANIKTTPKVEMLRAAEKRRNKMERAAFKQAEAECERAEKEIATLENEAMKVMMGETSAFSIELISQLMPKYKAKVEVAQAKMEELKKQMEDNIAEAENTIRDCERLLSWADIFDEANIETKHMIICSLIDRIEVGRGYKIDIRFKLTVEQYAGTT